MPDPEKTFADLTSGEPAAITELASAIGAQDPLVIQALDHITTGISGTQWTGLADVAARAASKEVYVRGTLVAWRLHRAAAVLEDVAAGQKVMESWARKCIRIWRGRPENLTPDAESDLRESVNFALALNGFFFTLRLRAAARELLDFDEEMLEWLRNGAGKDFDLAVKYGIQRGPRVPDAAASGDEGGWTPQGLGVDGEGNLLTTSYRTDPNDLDDKDDDVDDSQLTVIDGKTGEVTSQVQLLGENGGAAPKHSGGVAVHGDTVYVVGGGKLYEYSLKDIKNGGPVEARSVEPVDEYSYVTVHNNQLLLGNYKEGYLTRYPIGESGVDLADGVKVPTPSGTNGVAVLPNGQYAYSVNKGRDEEGKIVVDDTPDDGDLDEDHVVDIGNLPEELVVVDGKIVGTTESGADDYAPWDEDGTEGAGDDGANDTGGSESTDLEDFWAQTHMFEIPIDVLERASADGEFEVDPITLRAGAREVWTAGDGIESARKGLLGLHLPAGHLPTLSGAGALVRAAESRLDGDRRALSRLEGACERIGRAIKTSADDYTWFDALTGTSIDALVGRLLKGP